MIDRGTADITVHIERLIIEGFELAAADGVQLHLALESTLRDLYERHPLGRASDLQLASVPAPPIRLVNGQSGSESGGRIARSLYAAVER